MAFNPLLDTEQYHHDEVIVVGHPTPIPEGIGYSYSESRQVLSGGNPSTALNAVNYIAIDYDAAARRNIAAIRENIAREKAYQERQND